MDLWLGDVVLERGRLGRYLSIQQSGLYGGHAWRSYTTSMAITGSFTTAAPLPALMPSTQIGHGSFTFSSSAHIEKRVLGKCFLSGGIDGWQAKTQREVHHEN
jgi:hypothetical protein